MSPRLLVLIPSAVAINLAMGFLTNQLGLPLYLDTIGTVLTAALAGPVVGVATGLVSQLVRSLYEGFIWLPFGLVQVAIALLAAIALSHTAPVSAAVLADDRADALYHRYEGDDVTIHGPSVLVPCAYTPGP